MQSSPPPVQGDINFDGTLDVLDIMILVNAMTAAGYSNAPDLSDAQLVQADINGDGVLDMLDIVALVVLMINQGEQ